MSSKLKWKCPSCGLSCLLPESATVVRCTCGYSSDGVWTTTCREPGIPHWELQGRQRACSACPYLRDASCRHRGLGLDAGCKGAYRKMLHSPFAECPAGTWVKPHVRWVTTADLTSGAVHLAQRVPPDVSRVVGVPRSGMLPASVIATALHLPLYTVRGGRVEPVGGGSRMAGCAERPGRSLIVDDTVHGGHTLARLKEEGLDMSGSLVAAIYVRPGAEHLVDLFHEHLPTPHLLEWNLFNSAYMRHIATDLDGIICHNPPDSDIPLYLPRHVSVAAIITARPESERAATEKWLARWGVRYARLVMWAGGVEDRSLDAVAQWKAHQCLASGAEFYIESEPPLADAIRRTGIRALCPGQGALW